MSSVYDNWERLVQATLRREHDREIAYCESFSSRASDFSSRASDFSSRDLDINFESFREHVPPGTQAHISELISSGHKLKKKQLQIVIMEVRMDSDGCELELKKALSSLSGVQSVEIDRNQQKVTVIGYIEQNEVLEKAKSTGNEAEIWPSVPYKPEIWPSVPYKPVAHPCAYQAFGSFTRFEDSYIYMFNDDNTNACSIL